MDAINFAYWLNGFAELHGETPPTPDQWRSIREHLGIVFSKVTPPVSPSYPAIPLKSPTIDDTPWWNRQWQCGSPPPNDGKTRLIC